MKLHRFFCSLLAVFLLSMSVVSVYADDDDDDPGKDKKPAEGKVVLIEPIGDEQEIDIKPGAGTLIAYFNTAADWLIIVCVGICVIWVVIGGFEIMTSGGDATKRGNGQQHIMWAILGLLMLVFAGFILRTLNSMFFK